MSKPSQKIDGADVLYWAWSGEHPFGLLGSDDDSEGTPIFDLAIARYGTESVVYRFSCNRDWETEQDGVYSSVQEAMDLLPEQYRKMDACWIKYDG